MKFFLMLLSVAGMLILGGYIVAPKELFFEYDGHKYYKSDTYNVYESKVGPSITVEKTTIDDFNVEIFHIDEDNVDIRVSYRDDGVFLSITKGSLHYEDNLEVDEVIIDASLVKYRNLAYNYFIYQGTMNEDFSIVLYFIFGICILLGMIFLNSSISYYQRGFKVYGIISMIPASILIIVSLFINVILIVLKLN